MSDQKINPYRMEIPRQQALEEFYALMVGIDVIGGIREQLMDEDELEAWAELTVLDDALRAQASPAAAPEPVADGAGADDLPDYLALHAATDDTWRLPAEMATPEVKAVINRLLLMGVAKADRVFELEAELRETRARLAAAKSEADLWLDNYTDCANALAAVLRERGADLARIGDYEVYETSDGSASAIHVDADGKRIPTANAAGDVGASGAVLA